MRKHQTAISFFLLFIIVALGVHELYPTFYISLLLDLWQKIKNFVLHIFAFVVLVSVAKMAFSGAIK